jgi:hypothetical protein
MYIHCFFNGVNDHLLHLKEFIGMEN